MKQKKLWFTDDFSPANVAKLQAEGWILRKASACHASDTVENCDEVGGDVPKQYKQTAVAFDVTEGFIPVEQFDAVNTELVETQDELAKTKLSLDDATKHTADLEQKQAVQMTEFEQQKSELETQLKTLEQENTVLKAELAELYKLQNKPAAVDPSMLKVDELKALLTEKGIEFKPNANKEELLALVPKE